MTTIRIDHSAIAHDVLAIAHANAALDPDGQTFPWLPGYPLIGSTVYHDGQLYTVSHCERGPTKQTDVKLVRLVGQGHDGTAVAIRGELRPVSWTQRDEDWRHIA